MTDTPTPAPLVPSQREFTVQARWIHNPNGDTIANIDPYIGDRDAAATKIAATLNAAAALLAKIDDNPALFFGMEDTCQDEFDDLRNALESL